MPAALAVAMMLFASPGASAWRAVAPGVERQTVAHDSGAIEFLRFDLERFRADVVVPGVGQPKRAAAARVEAGALAAVNGGFFDTDGRPLGLRIAGGRVVLKLRPRVDWGVLVVRDRRARIVHSREYRPDPAVSAAIQVGPRLLVAGKPLSLKPQRARRTAVALDGEGRLLTLIASQGRMDARELAELLADRGFASALLLDGGSSTQLSAWVGDTGVEVPGGYAVPDLLLILPRR
jgi:hypothetical protein